MKKLAVSILLIFITAMLSFTQDTVYILHPIIGDIIDRHEKTDFNLFPEISTSRFEYSYIKLEGNTFRFIAHLFPDSMVTRQLDTSDIHRMEKDIESILISRKTIQEKPVRDPGSVVIIKDANEQINNSIVNEDTQEKISDETITNQRLQEDAERRKLVKQGSSINDNGLYIDFSKRKRKKK
jgi:hypothetical protein